MSKRQFSVVKKRAFFAAWLALVGIALPAIVFIGSRSSIQAAPAHAPAVPTASVLTARWADVLAHAAAPARGNPQARYTLAEFGDFQCRQCAHARPLLESLLADGKGRVKLVFIQRPIPQIHCWALPAAQAAQIAASQGKFWAMYDVLYSNQDNMEPSAYLDYAVQAGLRRDVFIQAVQQGEGRQQVMAAVHFSNALGVNETPLIALRDNTTGVVTEYVGVDGGEMPGDKNIPGIRALAASPPWAIR